MRLWHVPNARGSRSTIFLKMRRVGLYHFYSIPKFVSVVVNRLASRSLVPWEIFVRKIVVRFFGTQICPGPIATNVSICVRAGLPKPRGVPDTERIKDTKTLDYASTPLDANTLLPAVVCPECLPRVQFSDSFIEW